MSASHSDSSSMYAAGTNFRAGHKNQRATPKSPMPSYRDQPSFINSTVSSHQAAVLQIASPRTSYSQRSAAVEDFSRSPTVGKEIRKVCPMHTGRTLGCNPVRSYPSKRFFEDVKRYTFQHIPRGLPPAALSDSTIGHVSPLLIALSQYHPLCKFRSIVCEYYNRSGAVIQHDLHLNTSASPVDVVKHGVSSPPLLRGSRNESHVQSRSWGRRDRRGEDGSGIRETSELYDNHAAASQYSYNDPSLLEIVDTAIVWSCSVQACEAVVEKAMMGYPSAADWFKSLLESNSLKALPISMIFEAMLYGLMKEAQQTIRKERILNTATRSANLQDFLLDPPGTESSNSLHQVQNDGFYETFAHRAITDVYCNNCNTHQSSMQSGICVKLSLKMIPAALRPLAPVGALEEGYALKMEELFDDWAGAEEYQEDGVCPTCVEQRNQHQHNIYSSTKTRQYSRLRVARRGIEIWPSCLVITCERMGTFRNYESGKKNDTPVSFPAVFRPDLSRNEELKGKLNTERTTRKNALHGEYGVSEREGIRYLLVGAVFHKGSYNEGVFSVVARCKPPHDDAVDNESIRHDSSPRGSQFMDDRWFISGTDGVREIDEGTVIGRNRFTGIPVLHQALGPIECLVYCRI